MQSHKGVGCGPVTTRLVVAIYHDDSGVGLGHQDIRECHAHCACAHDEIVRLKTLSFNMACF